MCLANIAHNIFNCLHANALTNYLSLDRYFTTKYTPFSQVDRVSLVIEIRLS